MLVDVTYTPRDLADWGALGGIVGRLAGDYWQVPALIGIDRVPGSDEMKHFGAALASFGSVALFHMDGHHAGGAAARRRRCPQWRRCAARGRRGGSPRVPASATLEGIDAVDVVVFSAPQLSLVEMQQLADLLDGRRVDGPAARRDQPAGQAGRRPHGPDRADRGGRRRWCCPACASTRAMRARWRRRMAGSGLATNSAKLTNILGGYGYRPALLSMEACVDAACAGGKIVR